MKTLVYDAPEKVTVRELPEPELHKGQAKIRVSYCGVCGSDIGIYQGKHPRAKAPLVMGHEFVGTVEEIAGASEAEGASGIGGVSGAPEASEIAGASKIGGASEVGGTSGASEASEIRVGDKVAAYPLLSCGKCYPCRVGKPHICEKLRLIGIDLDGGMAEHVCADVDALFKLPEGVDESVCGLIEPLAVAVHAVRRSGFKPLDTAAIIGAGPIGVLVGMVLMDAGASKVIISDISEHRLEVASSLGMETVNSAEDSLTEYVAARTGRDGVNIVYECSGVESAAMEMTSLVCADGMVCLVGVHKAPRPVKLGDMHFRELNITATRVYEKEEFGMAVKYTRKLEDKLRKLITHIVDIEDSSNVFDIIADPDEKAMKVVIRC